MRITVTSLMVDDQAKAHAFYTEILGFVTKTDVPMGEHRWLTLVSPGTENGVELLLEPNDNPALNGLAETFQKALLEAGIPATAFSVDDVHAEAKRLKQRGVVFTLEPTQMGPFTCADFADTCGNLIRIASQDS